MNKIALKELCNSNEIGKYGIPASAEEFDVNKIRYLRITDIDDFGNLLHNDKKSVSSHDLDKYLLKEGDIVFARTGNSTGRTYYHEAKNGSLAFAGFLIKYGLDFKKINPKYVKYYTLSSEYKQWVKNLSIGSTRGNINALTFADCPISVPERSQQNLLVTVLSALDDKIELNNKINNELEEIAKTLYDYWFVQFDFPNEAEKPYKSSGGEMVYDKVLKREIPKGWEVKKLEEVESNIITGKTPSTLVESNFGGDIPFVTIDDIRKQLYIFKSDRTLTELGASTQSSKFLNDGDICVSCIGTVGVIGIVGKRCQTNQQINSISKIKNYNRYFLLNALRMYFEFNTGAKQGAVLSNMNKGEFSEILIVDPSLELKKKYLEKVKPLYQKIKNNLQQNQELASLRDWLLPMLMNGQVRVGDSDGEGSGLVAESSMLYNRSNEKTPAWYDERFELWISQQGLAARGNIDKATLRELFDAMNDEDK